MYNNEFLTKNRIYLFVCAHIFVCITCLQVIGILFMNFCLCDYIYISLRIEVILSLFISACFSCILSWIIWIEFVITLKIHQVFGVSLEEQSIYVIQFIFIHFMLFIYLFIYYYLFYFIFPQIIAFIYLLVHILEKWRYRWKKKIGIWSGCASINRPRDICVYEICRSRRKKTKIWW